MGQVWDNFPAPRLPLLGTSSTPTLSSRQRRRRARRGGTPDNLRGLPPEEHLARLALTYLTEQVRHWPDLASRGRIPRPTPDNAAALARAFRARQERGEVGPLGGWLGSMTIAAAYLRFSDENSNPRSLDDQLVNVLARAAADRQFIPWEYVFADFAVTGTNARCERRDIDVRIREAEAARARTAAPLTEAGVRAMLGRLREVLNQDVAVAAPVLRKLLGRIEVRQKARENKQDRATWLLRFKPTLAQAALEVEVGSGCPNRTTWEFLCGANWIPEPEVEVVVASGLPKYAEYREVVVQRINGGETGEAVARSLGISRGAVGDAWRYHHTGDIDGDAPPLPRHEGDATRLAERVAEMYHSTTMDFKAIGKHFGVSRTVAERAHNHWHELHPDGPDDIPHAAVCGRVGIKPPNLRREALEMPVRGSTAPEIAREKNLTPEYVRSLQVNWAGFRRKQRRTK